jgi:RimJ/RimL family protein N-acetyltransferase
MPEVLTGRLRLVPIGPEHVDDLVTLFADDVVAHWYGGTWTRSEAASNASAMAAAWRTDGVSKWMAYDRETGALIGRGGLSRLAPDNPVVPSIAALVSGGWRSERLELGWALLIRGRGYATEIGRAGLEYAFDRLAADEVVAFTERHNRASRAVMERLDMAHAGEISAPGLIEGRDGVHDNAPFAVYSRLVGD